MREVHALSGCLHLLAELFEREEQVLETSPERLTGWGQFLNVSREHSQIGLYGTGSGLLVRALAGRLQAGKPEANGRLLARWWTGRDDGSSQPSQYFAQTLRLAYLYLCIRIANTSPVAEIEAEVYTTLLSRQLNGGLWGNWWLSSELRDPTPRLFTSAIVLLSCGLFKDPASTPDQHLVEAAASLEKGILDHSDVPSAHVAAAAAALNCTVGHRAKPEFSRVAISVARNSPWRVVDQVTYFYEYRGVSGDPPVLGRDYFIVPPAHLLAIAGHQPTSPGALKAATQPIVGTLLKNVRENGGAYRTEPHGLVSSKNQAWSALVFAAVGGATDATATERLGYSLFKHRTSRWNPVEAVRLAGLILSTVTLGALAEGRVCKAVLMVCTLLLSEFYRIKSHIWVRRW